MTPATSSSGSLVAPGQQGYVTPPAGSGVPPSALYNTQTGAWVDTTTSANADGGSTVNVTSYNSAGYATQTVSTMSNSTGQMTSGVTTYYDGEPGTNVIAQQNFTNSYNASGNLVTTEIVSYGADSELSSRQEINYSLGTMEETSYEWPDSPDQATSIVTTTYYPPADGQEVTSLTDLTVKSVVTQNFNEDGQMTSVNTIDCNPDGTVASNTTETNPNAQSDPPDAPDSPDTQGTPATSDSSSD
jgi:hypothetical protein